MNYKQEAPADHVELSEVLKALGIEAAAKPEGGAQAKIECDGDVCQLKK